MTQTLDRSQPTEDPYEKPGKLFDFPSGQEIKAAIYEPHPVVQQLDGIAKILAAGDFRPSNFLRDEIGGHNYSTDVEIDGVIQRARLIFSLPTKSELDQDAGKVDTLLLSQSGDFLMSVAQHREPPRRNHRYDHSFVLNYHFRETLWEKIQLVKIPEEYVPAIEAFLDPESTSDNFGGSLFTSMEIDVKRHERNQRRNATLTS